jgi:serine/threonine-protein kinase
VTLATLVRDTGPLSAGRAIHFLTQACASLAEAHSFGLIHRDLKPENLMACCRGNVRDTIKVLDFGLATVVSANTDRSQLGGGISGTPHYMSPEAITAPQSIDGRSDVYSLSAVGYYLLTGKTVFCAAGLNEVLKSHVCEIPQRPSVRLGSPIDTDLEDVILQGLMKAREDRPASPDVFRRMLSQCRSAGSWDPDDAVQPSAAPLKSPAQESITEPGHDGLSDTLLSHQV